MEAAHERRTKNTPMSLATQIIDQRFLVSSLNRKKRSPMLRLGHDESKRRATAFLFLVAKTMFSLTDEETLDSDGGNDFGIDVLCFEPPVQGELKIALIQGKYRTNLDGEAAFPENGIAKMIDAIGALCDPGKGVTGLSGSGLKKSVRSLRRAQSRAWLQSPPTTEPGGLRPHSNG